MSDLKKATEDALAWSTFLDAVTAITQEQRATVLAAMLDAGSERQRGDAGLISLVRAKPTATITNRAALLAWVREHRPDMLISIVNPAFEKHLKDQCQKHGNAFDTETGEVIPGVELVQSDASLRIVPEEEAKTGARELVRRLAIGEAFTLKELER